MDPKLQQEIIYAKQLAAQLTCSSRRMIKLVKSIEKKIKNKRK